MLNDPAIFHANDVSRGDCHSLASGSDAKQRALMRATHHYPKGDLIVLGEDAIYLGVEIRERLTEAGDALLLALAVELPGRGVARVTGRHELINDTQIALVPRFIEVATHSRLVGGNVLIGHDAGSLQEKRDGNSACAAQPKQAAEWRPGWLLALWPSCLPIAASHHGESCGASTGRAASRRTPPRPP